jgi:DNA-binding transcriptional MocR family regulator
MRREIGFRPSYAAVYSQLLHWENRTTGDTCPGQRSLARSLGYARETVNRACAWLELRGYIRSQQRLRRIAGNGVRFLSKRYWVAKERGQVAWMLAHLTRRGRELRERWERAPVLRKFSSDREITPPSRTELNPEEVERLRALFQARWAE